MDIKTQINYGQPGSTEYILRSLVAKSASGVVKVAPGTARRILEELNFPGQRKISESRVYGHSHKIISGDWMESFPIHFAALPDGRVWLVDGQNRLTAISRMDAPVEVTLLIADFDNEKEVGKFYAGFDQRSSVRTNGQILSAVGIAKETGLKDRTAKAIFEAAPLLMNGLEPLVGSANVCTHPEMFLQDNRLKIVSEWAREALHPIQTSLDVGRVLPHDENDDPENDDLEVGKDFPPQVATHGGSRPQAKGFAASTAEATGMTKRAINQHIARADALGDEALAKVVNTSLDSGVELDALAKLPEPERAQLVERAAAGEKVSARTPATPVKPSNAPARNLPMRLYKAVHDMVHGLGFKDVESLIEAIVDLPELTKAEQSTLDDALDIFLSIGELVPRAAEAA